MNMLSDTDSCDDDEKEMATDDTISESDDSDTDVILIEDSDEESTDYEPESDMENQQPLVSKDGEVWAATPHVGGRQRKHNIVRERAGPIKSVARSCTDPYGVFSTFITSNMLENIVMCTNAEGERLFYNVWKHIDLYELQTYIGLLLLAGVYRARLEPIQHLWNVRDGRPIFGKAMSRNRFSLITRCLRFDKKDDRVERRARDKLAAIREFHDSFASKCRGNYHVGCNVSVDEQLVLFHGRCSFKVYMPNKPGKYGIKLWVCADVETSYCSNFEVYCGKRGRKPEVGQGARVVLQMTEHLCNSGRNVTCDNFFSSLFLSKSLLAKRLTYIGTVRRNKTFLPSQLILKNGRDRYSSFFAFQKDTTLVSYVPKKDKMVTLMSTQHHIDAIHLDRKDKKPDIILAYNATKGAVDNLDKMTRTYSCKRKTKRWPMALFSNFLDIAAVNAFVVYMSVHPQYNSGKSHKRRIFIEELALSMIKDAVDQHLPPVIVSQETSQSNVLKRKRCNRCPTTSDRKGSQRCSKCGFVVCKEHTGSCQKTFTVVCTNCL